MPSLNDEILQFLSAEHPDREAITRNPYAFYDRLRSHSPVAKTSLGPWLVTSYALVREVVTDERWHRESQVREADLSLAERVFLRSLVFRDPPAHTRLRRILAPAFTPTAIERRRQQTRAVAQEILRRLRVQGDFDFRNDFAAELPVRVICSLLGMPLDERERFSEWLEALRGLQELSHDPPDEREGVRRSTIAVPARREVLQRADKIAEDCLEYFERLVAAKRAARGDDIISLLVSTSEADEAPLSHEELVATLIILHIGGYATTTDLIATGQYTLFRHPGAASDLRREPGLVQSAVEEMARYEPPVTVGIPRIASVDIELGGIRIPQGDHLYPVLAAANRDPIRFADPHRFDIHRADNRHLAFAQGIHFCLGAPLGRQEAQEAFRLLATEYPPLAPVGGLDQLRWQSSLPHRGLTALPVTWTS